MNHERDIDVLSFGESLVDFLPDQKGVPLSRVETFRKVVGGAPTNLALGVGRLGRTAALIGKIGADEFGDFIVDSLDQTGVVTSGIHRTDQARTGLTFVTLDQEGDRSFLFYRNPSADELLEPDEVDPELVARSRIFQVGSNMLTDERLRRTTLRAVELAEQSGCLI